MREVLAAPAFAVRAIRLVVAALPIHHQFDSVLQRQLRSGQRGLEQELGLPKGQRWTFFSCDNRRRTKKWCDSIVRVIW